MKVDFSANINMYRKNVVGPSKSAPAEAARGKTDVIEFSKGSTAAPAGEVSALKPGILSDVNRPADAERLRQLSQQIKDGTYGPSTDELVDAILNS